MIAQYYEEALKAAQRERRRCISHGYHPYLPALEEMISPELLLSGTSIGIVQIPAEFIVGTKTQSRTNAFAGNFMPLLPETSEFACKWKKLCEAHLEEGIRDPIKVYEYMNRFYVEEGNKRVSVLKFFDAVTILAQVTRILPPKNDSLEVRLYYEFLDFYKCSKINFIEFSKEGSYAKLQKLLGKNPNESWTEEEQRAFNSNYYYFQPLFEAMGGKKLKCTTADALLVYLTIYGYESLSEKNAEKLKLALQKIWEEFELLQEEQSISLKTDPEEEKKKNLLQRILSDEAKKEKVAFLYDKTPEVSGWTYAHELGRQHVQTVFHGRILTTAYENVMDLTPHQAIEQAIADGNHIIFTTSPKFFNASLTAAIEHPELLILNCSLNKPHRYIRTYYARMYEVKFIIGAIAGALTENDKVGYLCDYPIYGQIAGINAFAMGVQMVNPRAKVYLEWSCVDDVQSALCRLLEQEISLISSQDLEKPTGDDGNPFGLFKFDENGLTNLAVPIWHWGVYYEKLIRSILNHTMQSEYDTSSKALNYYWGMSAGVVELICSKHLPEGIQKLADLLSSSISSGLFAPFQLSLERIIAMDWLADNVVGIIPIYEQLNEEGKETVESAGSPAAAAERKP